MSNKMLICIRERFDHMGTHSGYDMLFEEIEKTHLLSNLYIEKLNHNRFVRKTATYLFKHLNKTPFYGITNFLAEITTLTKGFFKKKIIHVSYGENNYNVLRKVKLWNKVVVTFHQPIEWWEGLGIDLTEYFRNIDTIIVLNEKEKINFEKYAPQRVVYIPHGISNFYFNQDKLLRNDRTLVCITVGQWLRDFNTLEKIISYCQPLENIKFRLVISQEKITHHPHADALNKIIGYSSVIWHDNLSDEELRNLYLSSDLLLLPLEKATANNALLEAMACGLPIFTSNIDGVLNYLTRGNSILFDNKDIESIVSKLKYYTSNPKELIDMGFISKQLIRNNFLWEIIAKRTLEIYKQL